MQKIPNTHAKLHQIIYGTGPVRNGLRGKGRYLAVRRRAEIIRNECPVAVVAHDVMWGSEASDSVGGDPCRTLALQMVSKNDGRQH